MIEISHLKVFKDNYIWLIIWQDQLIVVDPGESNQVIDYITTNQLVLNSILLTHSHLDHVGGVAELIKVFPKVNVYGANSYARILVSDSDRIEILPELNVTVIYTPGHTLDGVSFLVNNQHLFCGDTLFSGGCGRVFTGDYALMYQSLLKIKTLDIKTLIYPAHEYTLGNLQFAASIEPHNSEIINRLTQVEQLSLKHQITVPTTLQLELKINPFLRCNKDILSTTNQATSELEKFIALRKLKDVFILPG